MKKLIIKTASAEDFFKRGRRLARRADQGKRLPEACVISFEDPADFEIPNAVTLAAMEAARRRENLESVENLAELWTQLAQEKD